MASLNTQHHKKSRKSTARRSSTHGSASRGGGGGVKKSRPGKSRSSQSNQDGSGSRRSKTKRPHHDSGTSTSGGARHDDQSDHDNDNDEDFPEPPNAQQFTYLKAQTRHVPQDTVIKEWKPMPELAQQRIADLLVAAKRGVVNNTAKSAKRAEEVAVTIDPLLKRIVSRLPRMLAPPKTKEENFNLEKLLERSRSLESQLTATLHSIELLKAEIDREEDGLENDEKKLAEMENNVKAEETLWKKQAKRAENTIELPDEMEDLGDGAEEIGLVQEDSEMLESLFDDSDPDLAPILAQLSNHLESIHGNSMQVQGISTALQDSSLALEAVLNR